VEEIKQQPARAGARRKNSLLLLAGKIKTPLRNGMQHIKELLGIIRNHYNIRKQASKQDIYSKKWRKKNSLARCAVKHMCIRAV